MEPSKKNFSRGQMVVFFIAGIVVLLFALWLFTPVEVGLRTFFSRPSSFQLEKFESFNINAQAVKAYWKGDYDSTRKILADVLARGENDSFYLANKALESSLMYAGADTPAKRRAAIENNLALYHVIPESDADSRAVVINSLVDALVATPDPEYMQLVFGDAEFASLYVQGDKNASLANLVQKSLATKPTWWGELLASYLTDGKELWIAFKRGGDFSTADIAQKKKNVTDALARAEVLYNTAAPSFQYSVRGIGYPAWYSYWRGALLSTLARVDASFTSLAENEYKKTVEYSARTAPDGNTYAILEGPLLAAHLGYAVLLYDTGDHSDAVKSHLDLYAQIIKNNPEGNATHIVRIKEIWQAHLDAEAGKTADREMLERYEYYKKGADTSSLFKNLLTSNGWRI